MARTEVNIITAKQKTIARSRRIFFAENTGPPSSMGALATLFMLGTCVHTVRSFHQVHILYNLMYIANSVKIKVPRASRNGMVAFLRWQMAAKTL